MGMNDDGYTRFHLGTLRSEIACTGNVIGNGNVAYKNVVDVGPEFALVRNRSADGVLWVESGVGGDGSRGGNAKKGLTLKKEGPNAEGKGA